MNITGNTILVTGGGSGIGRGLAESFHAAGNKVIIAGRRKAALAETINANPGMASASFDVTDADSIRTLAAHLVNEFPSLNVLVNNAGIMRTEKLIEGELADAEATITTNLLGPIRLTAALLSQLRAQKTATIINITSGLAFVPLAMTPTYSATKAAMHSYTQSLRHQLCDTSIEVIELAPPAVATDLMADSRANPRSMPLDDFITESVGLLRSVPQAQEILVERVKFFRGAEARGQFDTVFATMNSADH